MINVFVGFTLGFLCCLVVMGASLKASDFGSLKFDLMPLGSIVSKTDKGFFITTPSGLSVEVKDRKNIIPFLTEVE